MQFLGFCILLLTIGEPLLVLTDKVLLVIPQQTRRSLGPSWRSAPPRYRKSSHDTESHYHKYYSPPFHHHKRPVHGSAPLPHGGDDFDQGHEQVNHVHLPYGKGISHAISYGKGYIPYDKVKNAISYGPESHYRHSGSQGYKHSEPDYESTSYSSSGDYPPSGQLYEAHQSEAYFSNPDSDVSYNERRNDEKKFYTSRSIEKELTANSAIDFNGAANKDQLLLLQQKSADLFNNITPHPEGGVVLPTGVPSATIGGSKEGIVLRDTVSMDEYQQKLQEMTKSWPQFLSNAATTFNSNFHNQPVTASYTIAASSTPFNGWSLNFAQPKGYDVKEDTMEPPHDFRTAPIQTTPYQTYSIPVNVAQHSVVQMVQG